LFTFFADCNKRCGREPAVVLGDARLTLGRSDEKYGVLVVDAFSSDAIPVHLLTREALAVYRAHLDDDGVLLFNISNRYLDLEPVLAELAADADPPLTCVAWPDLFGEEGSGKSASHWVMMSASPEALKKARGTGPWRPARRRPGLAAWRDDYSNLLGVIKWRPELD